MKQKSNPCTKAKIASAVLSVIAVALIIGSFFVPPTGVVDSSVLAAVGEIFAFAALFAVWLMIVLDFRVSALYAGLFSEFFYCFFILL